MSGLNQIHPRIRPDTNTWLTAECQAARISLGAGIDALVAYARSQGLHL